jgi:hypothetical protein
MVDFEGAEEDHVLGEETEEVEETGLPVSDSMRR